MYAPQQRQHLRMPQNIYSAIFSASFSMLPNSRDIGRVIPLQAQRRLFFRHFQMAVQHGFPFGLIPARVYASEKPGDILRIFIPFYAGFLCLGRFAMLRGVYQISGYPQMLRKKLLELSGRFFAEKRLKQPGKILRV